MQGLLTDSMPGTQSAISQMLGLLMQHPPAGQPGQPAPPPVAPTAMPPQGDPQAQTAEPPQSLLGKVHDFIQDRMGGNVPAEYKNSGLLSPDEIRQAKPGIMEELAHSDSYRKNLNRVLEMKGAVLQAQEHQRVMGTRQRLGELFPATADETHTDRMNRLEKMYAYSLQNGDTEMADRLKGVVAELANTKQTNPAANIKEVPGVGAVDFTDPQNPRIVMKSPSAQRNIDPLSDAGIAAQLKLNAAKAESKSGGSLAAPMAAKVGQAGEMVKKLSDLMPATDALNVSLANSAAQDAATHGVGIGGLHVPGTQGLGSMMVNRSPEYATYQAALTPFILAAAHALSGARINDTQVQQIRASVEIKPGESPKARAQKHKNLIDLVNSITGSLPADAIAAQEDQMDPNAIAMLKGYGYRGAKRGTDATPAPGGKKDADYYLRKHNIIK